ncbi:MAG: TAXI family TRAP transporter solute-binding subunit [Burkholderiales bacterium]|nr:TAXI family TRAP transporter solute-binding subunit [Burkholderiales bacterium]
MAAGMPTIARASSGLPGTLIFTSHGAGSGNILATIVADALQKHASNRIRVTPASNGVGLVLPMKTGRADYTFAANELFFASEAAYEFGTREWNGPQDLRIVLAPPKALGLATARDANILTPKDLKGKRLAYVKGSPSVNVKLDAYLAFAGLTRKDVEVVWLSNSARGSKEALINNQADAATYTPNSAAMKEVELSPRGLRWVEFPPEDKAGWARMQAIMPVITPRRETQGEAMSEAHPVNMMGWRYPQIACYASKSEEEVYNFVKVLDQIHDSIKASHPDVPSLHISHSGKTPADAPFHDGAIRYLKEKGVWTAQDQAWQDARIARIATVRRTWNKATADFPAWLANRRKTASGLSEADGWAEFWAGVSGNDRT